MALAYLNYLFKHGAPPKQEFELNLDLLVDYWKLSGVLMIRTQQHQVWLFKDQFNEREWRALLLELRLNLPDRVLSL